MKTFLKFFFSLMMISSEIKFCLNQIPRTTTRSNSGNMYSASSDRLTTNGRVTGSSTISSGAISRVGGSVRTGNTVSSTNERGRNSNYRTPGTTSSSTSGWGSPSSIRNSGSGYTTSRELGTSSVSRNHGTTTTSSSINTSGGSRNNSSNRSEGASSFTRSSTGISFRDRGIFNNPEPSPTLPNTEISYSSTSTQPETPSTSTPSSNISAVSSSPISSVDISKSSLYGKFLINGDGMSLYVNVKDGPGVVTCYDECAKRFIPTYIKVGESININTQLDEKLIATLGRRDGVSQLTYNDYPLYVYAGDKEPGDTTGQGYEETWYLMNEKGKPIQGNGSNQEEPISTTNSIIEYNTAGSAGKTLKITGTTSILVVPDTFIMYFNIFTKNTDFVAGLKETEKKSKDLVAIIRKLNSDFNSDMTKVSLVDRKMFFQNDTSIFSNSLITTTTQPGIIDKVSTAIRRLNKRNYNIVFNIEYTINEKTIAQVKTYLYTSSVKTAIDNAVEMTDKLKYQIDKQRPIKSISIDSTALQDYYPLYFSDTSSFYLLNQNKGVIILTLKSITEFNIKS